MSENISRAILDLMINARRPVSGQHIASRLGVTRTAVWKGMNHLRGLGFVIEARPGVGYVVSAFPDRLVAELVRRDLGTAIVGREVRCLEVTDSTNLRVREEASRGAAEGLVITAEEQTRGRGRVNRTWQSPSGANLLFSVLLRPPLLPTRIFRLNLVTSVALVEALEQLTSLKPLIKWPNDIYVGGRKLAGILTEFSGAAEGVEFAVVGVGFNVNHHPPDESLPTAPATSLRAELGAPFSRLELLREILRCLDRRYRELKNGTDQNLGERWNQLSLVTGQRVTISSFGEVEHGIARSVDRDGALLVETDDGRVERVVCGDVSVRLEGPADTQGPRRS